MLAELLPPLEEDGTSHLWDALGRHFTGLTYAEADILSKKNKEFIRSLFPEGTIYASLLPKQAQEVIGKVGVQTRGVEKMLRRIGFRYAERVDPFDGGPHFTAPTDEITLVQRTHKTKVARLVSAEQMPRSIERSWASTSPSPRTSAPGWTHWSESEDGGTMEAAVAGHLGLGVGSEVWVLPLE